MDDDLYTMYGLYAPFRPWIKLCEALTTPSETETRVNNVITITEEHRNKVAKRRKRRLERGY